MRLRTATNIIIAIVVLIFIGFLIRLVTMNRASDLQSNEPISKPTISKNDAKFGSNDPEHTVVHFGFIGCKYCAEFQTTVLDAIEDGSSIQLVWKDYPNTDLAPQSLSGAIAARCAQEQDAFWEYQAFLFGNSNKLANDFYVAVAEDLDLNLRKFNTCLEKGRGAELVEASINEGNRLNITAAPTVFINDERFTGEISARDLQDILAQ